MSFKSLMDKNPHFLDGGLILSFECTEVSDNFQEIVHEHMKFAEAYSRGVMDMTDRVKDTLEEELNKARAEARLEGYEAGYEAGVASVTEVSFALAEDEEEQEIVEDFPAWFEEVFFGSCGLGKVNFTPPTHVDNPAPKFEVESSIPDLPPWFDIEMFSAGGLAIDNSVRFITPSRTQADAPILEDNLCDHIQMRGGEIFLPMITSTPPMQAEAVEEPKQERKHSHYFKDVSKFDEMDTYLLARVWGIKDENGALFHALKKMLDAGKRGGGKDKLKDISEARDSLNRYLAVEEIMKDD